MTILSDLSQDLAEEILCRVPITSLGAVRSTCKGWNVLSKDRIICKTEPKQQCIGFTVMNYRLCSIRFHLNEDLVAPSIKPVSDNLKQAKICEVFYCQGLLLCLTMNNHIPGLIVWNPYLGQTRWIKSKTMSKTMYAFGYDKNNNNHKILMIFYDKRNYYQIYDLKSDSWKDFNDIPSWDIDFYHGSASVNGNSYFWTKEKIQVESSDDSDEDEDEDDTPNFFLICFDFTAERFGQLLPLPFDYKFYDYGTLSCVKEEKLAALYMRRGSSEMEIWVTTKIEPNQVLWSNLFKVDMEPNFTYNFQLNHEAGSLFFDQEKKVAMFFGSDRLDCFEIKAYIIGENRYLKKVGLVNAVGFSYQLKCSSFSYVPSLVQINQIGCEKKRKGTKEF